MQGSLWSVPRRLIYAPDARPAGPAEGSLPGAHDVSYRSADGLSLSAWFAPAYNGTDTGHAVLLAPGARGNRTHRTQLAQHLRDRGLAVFLMDYRGFGGNPGTPSEMGLARDAAAALETLMGLGYPPERIILFGRGVVNALVVRLATQLPVKGVLLQSPFPDLVAVAAHNYPWLPVRRLLSERYPVTEHLQHIKAPVAIVYGEQDLVVPAELSRRVAADTPTLAEVLALPAFHDDYDDVMSGPEVADVVARLLTRDGDHTS